MPSTEIQEFAQILVRQVRDKSVLACDALIEVAAVSPVATRWRGHSAPHAEVKTMIPDIIDETVFALLHAIDEGSLRLKFVSTSGREVDLTEEGLGELAGWYMCSGGWRALFSEERFVDDFADIK